ncbi:MAG TPA: O-antigen ligase family protein [Firmicutes bacterium]|nr:O-antigen ligase family protein [Bacillota bacterium]
MIDTFKTQNFLGSLAEILKNERLLRVLIVLIITVVLVYAILYKHIDSSKIIKVLVISAILITSLRYPFILVLLLILTELNPVIFDRFAVNVPFIGPCAPRRILGFIAVIVLFINHAIIKKKFQFVSPWIWTIFLFILTVFTISNINAPYPNFTKIDMMKWFQFMVFTFLLINIADSVKKINYIFEVYVITTAIDIIYILYSQQFETRFGAFAFDPNYLAAITCIAFAYISSRMPIIKDNLRRLLYVILLIFIPAIIIFTQSRSGFIVLCSIIFLYLIRVRKNWKYLLIVTLIMLIFMTTLPEKYTSRVLGFFSKGKKELKEEPRYKLTMVAIDIFKKNPLFGGGSGAYWYEFGTKYCYEMYGKKKFKAVHNEYLKLLSENGLFGFLSVVILIFYSFSKIVKLLRKIKYEDNPEFYLSLYNVFVLFVVSYFVLNLLFSGFNILFISLVFCMENIYENRTLKKENEN